MDKEIKKAPQNAVRCCVCGATTKTLYKGYSGDEKMYICKECYMDVEKSRNAIITDYLKSQKAKDTRK